MEEKRRSLESQKDGGQRETQKESARNESFEKREDGTSPRSGEKPPQVPLTFIYVSATFQFSYFLSGGSKREKEEVKQGGESRGRWSVSDAEAQHEKAQGFL